MISTFFILPFYDSSFMPSESLPWQPPVKTFSFPLLDLLFWDPVWRACDIWIHFHIFLERNKSFGGQKISQQKCQENSKYSDLF